MKKHFNTTHGLSKFKLYDVHRQMLKRCYDSNSKDYPGYGGRGISVCKEWNDVHAFFNWAYKSGYKEGLTIERIDVNGNYCPENCTWIENKMQGRNTRRVRFLQYDGKSMSVSDWSRETGINIRTLINRLNLGWSVEKTLSSIPAKGRNQWG